MWYMYRNSLGLQIRQVDHAADQVLAELYLLGFSVKEYIVLAFLCICKSSRTTGNREDNLLGSNHTSNLREHIERCVERETWVKSYSEKVKLKIWPLIYGFEALKFILGSLPDRRQWSYFIRGDISLIDGVSQFSDLYQSRFAMTKNLHQRDMSTHLKRLSTLYPNAFLYTNNKAILQQASRDVARQKRIYFLSLNSCVCLSFFSLPRLNKKIYSKVYQIKSPHNTFDWTSVLLLYYHHDAFWKK